MSCQSCGCDVCRCRRSGPSGPSGPTGTPGSSGPSGPSGISGPSGPAGVGFASFQSAFSQLIQVLTGGSDIRFEVSDISLGPDISYNPTNGHITFLTKGTYKIDFGVNVDETSPLGGTIAAVDLNIPMTYVSSVIATNPSLPKVIEHFIAFAITISTTPTSVVFRNITGNPITISRNPGPGTAIAVTTFFTCQRIA